MKPVEAKDLLFRRRPRPPAQTAATDSASLKGVPLPPDGILFMNKTAQNGLQQGTSHARKLGKCGVNVRNGLLLDVGCGWGRLAYGLLNTGFEGKYLGVDIVRQRVDWLNANFASVHPEYAFHFSDVRNDLYNPDGRLSRIVFKPILGGALPTSIILLSVFTHMYEDDIAAYLADLSAIMGPSTSLVFSCFLFDGVAEEGIKRGSARRSFHYELSQDCRYDRKGQPLAAIAYREPLMLRLLDRAGLTGRVVRGNWSGSESTSEDWAQDIIIAGRSAQRS
jgi:hypothetical protein